MPKRLITIKGKREEREKRNRKEKRKRANKRKQERTREKGIGNEYCMKLCTENMYILIMVKSILQMNR